MRLRVANEVAGRDIPQEFVDEKIEREMKERVWEMVRPYVTTKVEEERPGVKKIVKTLDFSNEMRQFCVKDPNGYFMQPACVLIIQPIMEYEKA